MDPIWTQFGPVAARVQSLPKPIRAHERGHATCPGMTAAPITASVVSQERRAMRNLNVKVNVPANRQVLLELPDEVSPGEVELTVIVRRAARPAVPSRRW